MHNLDWSQFTVFDHLIACLMIAGFVLFAVFVPLALVSAFVTFVRECDL